jgi:hypothetical protein
LTSARLVTAGAKAVETTYLFLYDKENPVGSPVTLQVSNIVMAVYDRG